MRQDDTENVGRHSSPTKARVAADVASSMDSPWIEHELRSLRAMCESNRRNQENAEQVCFQYPLNVTQAGHWKVDRLLHLFCSQHTCKQEEGVI